MQGGWENWWITKGAIRVKVKNWRERHRKERKWNIFFVITFHSFLPSVRSSSSFSRRLIFPDFLRPPSSSLWHVLHTWNCVYKSGLDSEKSIDWKEKETEKDGIKYSMMFEKKRKTFWGRIPFRWLLIFISSRSFLHFPDLVFFPRHYGFRS